MDPQALLLFPGGKKRDPEVDAWLLRQPPRLGEIARHWFERMRACGDDVRELLHDGAPTVCVRDAAFAYVNVFTSHASIGFFYGAFLRDPKKLLEGSGKRMRHVKARVDEPLDEAELAALVDASYADILERLGEQKAPVRKTRRRRSRT